MDAGSARADGPLGLTSEEWWMTLWSHGMRGYLERLQTTLGDEALAKFKAEAFEALQLLKTSDGIHQRLPVLYAPGTKP